MVVLGVRLAVAAFKDTTGVGLKLIIGVYCADDCPLADYQLFQPLLRAPVGAKVVRDASLQAVIHPNVYWTVERGLGPQIRVLVLTSQVHFVLQQPVKVGVQAGSMATVGPLVVEAAVNELLLRVVAEPVGDSVEAGLDGPNGGKGHTGVALALVLHRGHML